ncbi:MAG: hypothetical protein IT376_06645 [Polyangiaceae bacterium]|nr:hypothetical protein [Polyangiaceae bacterium]
MVADVPYRSQGALRAPRVLAVTAGGRDRTLAAVQELLSRGASCLAAPPLAGAVVGASVAL